LLPFVAVQPSSALRSFEEQRSSLREDFEHSVVATLVSASACWLLDSLSAIPFSLQRRYVQNDD
jgi:hypothetical protein